MRSILVVPAARPSARGALASEADAIALDLAGDDDDEARRAAIELLGLAQAIGKTALVMIRPLASGRADADLDAVMTAKPRAIVLPDAIGGRDVQHLGAKLAVREAENDHPTARPEFWRSPPIRPQRFSNSARSPAPPAA